MGERQGPKTQVRSSVRDTSKDKLDGLDNLMYGYLADIMLFMIAVVVMLFHISLLLLCDQLVRNLVFGEMLIDVVLFMFFGKSCRHFAPKDEWLEDQHPRHAKQSSNE